MLLALLVDRMHSETYVVIDMPMLLIAYSAGNEHAGLPASQWLS